MTEYGCGASSGGLRSVWLWVGGQWSGMGWRRRRRLEIMAFPHLAVAFHGTYYRLLR